MMLVMGNPGVPLLFALDKPKLPVAAGIGGWERSDP